MKFTSLRYFPQMASKIILDYYLTLWTCFGSIGVRLQAFQLAWEYLLFDNRMKQARTRLVTVCAPGVPVYGLYLR
jgi:hypothetical protein